MFAQLVDDPGEHPGLFSTNEEVEFERDRLFSIIEELVDWKKSASSSTARKAQSEIYKYCGEKNINVYDPFSGSGTIPSEALRLGVNGFGSDLNPVAVVISKSRTEILPRSNSVTPKNKSGKTKTTIQAQTALRKILDTTLIC